MRVLYGRHYEDRMRAVADEVPPGASVLELCCGPGTLYQRYLRERVSSYVGCDLNPRFVRELRAQGVDARALDLAAVGEPLPSAQVAIIQASLYHFLPDAAGLVERMLDAAQDRVIISEPIRNLASSGLPLVGALGRRAADPGAGGHEQRFNEETLEELMGRFRQRVLKAFPIPGGREKVYVLDARPPLRSKTEAGS